MLEKANGVLEETWLEIKRTLEIKRCFFGSRAAAIILFVGGIELRLFEVTIR